MRKFAMSLTAAVFVLGSMAVASAQTQGAGSIHSLAQNATPIVKHSACGGWGPFCPPGRTRVCGPYRCWCRPCW